MVLKAFLPKTLLALLPLFTYACAPLPERSAPTPQRVPVRVQSSPPTVSVPPLSAPAAPSSVQPAPAATPSHVEGHAPSGSVESNAAPRPIYPAAATPPSGAAMALLLPLSGQFSQSAEAVRDGFLSVYYSDPSHPPLRLYDVGGSADSARAAYAQALSEGAGIIVGPLTKEGVASLAAMGGSLPVLGLNYLDASTPVPANFFQFGLAPEDEARSAAQLALARNQRRAVALVPNSEWGTRSLAAFDEALRKGGGQVVRAQRYTQGVNDQSKLIADLMGVSESEERHRALSAVLGAKSEFESQRRGDIDLVFLGARAQDARLLVPQLRFNRAGDLPIYTTALVYDGGQLSPDLAGLRFCDEPWMIGSGDALAAQRASAAALASAKSSPRLYAMGRDSYSLAVGLMRGSLRVGDGLDGASGRLEWQDRSAIGRRLECVQMGSDSLRTLQP